VKTRVHLGLYPYYATPSRAADWWIPSTDLFVGKASALQLDIFAEGPTMTDSETSSVLPAKTERRHDLDALRAIAMLLGIALHAALAFSGTPWVVQDSQTNEVFGLFFLAVHGFRMPLFFLVSGFFTAMLWRKRGLNALIKHRAKRILLPCLLGLITIVPAMAWVSTHIDRSAETVAGQSESSPTLIAAVRKNDVDAIAAELASGADVNAQDPLSGITPLSWAALHGHPAAAKILIENGANLESANRDGARPLHAAAFLGRTEVVKLLMECGADIAATDQKGSKPIDTTHADWGTVQFISGLLQLSQLDRKDVQQGQRECSSLLSGQPVEDRQVDKSGDLDDASDDVSNESNEVIISYTRLMSDDTFRVTDNFHLISTPVFHHLWFLWFLCWLVLFFAIYASVASLINFTGLPAWVMLSPLKFLWLLPLTMIPQWFMGVVIPSFGPDTSIGLIPQPHLLLYYGIFFAFGALYFDCKDDDGRLGRWWFVSLPLAIFIALPVGIATTFVSPDRSASLIVQTIYVWAMTFGMIGLFRKFMNSESKTMRYVSDSSYWLYVAHLPLVIWLQGLVRDWPMSPFVKFALICIVSTGLLLVSYQTLVRYTWLGRLLNGPRTRPSTDDAPSA
jgi:surface polysaccharide O-acyltransferase-like enzyme